MEERVKFRLGEQSEFLSQVDRRSGLSSEKLGEMVGAVGRSYRDWRRGKLNMTLKAARFFCQQYNLTLPEEESVLVQRAYKQKLDGGKRGGYACFRLHGSPATLAGRQKGGKRTLEILRFLGKIPQPRPFSCPDQYSMELAEFVGIMLGDGHLGEQAWSITLNSIADKSYVEFVVGLTSTLFGFIPHVATRKDCNATIISGSGEKAVSFFRSLGLRSGDKVKQQVGIPEWIKENKEFSKVCMRGLMDTDGGVFVHKYRVNGKEYEYLKICFTNRSIPILVFVKETMESFSFSPKFALWSNSEKVWLYNQSQVERYIREIGTHNPRLLKHIGGVG